MLGRNSEYPNVLPEFSVIKNIISIHYSDKEDFTEVSEFSTVDLKDLYLETIKTSPSSIDPIQLNAHLRLEAYLLDLKRGNHDNDVAYMSDSADEKSDDDVDVDFTERLLNSKQRKPIRALYGDPRESNKLMAIVKKHATAKILDRKSPKGGKLNKTKKLKKQKTRKNKK
jgi:hypothetical protein